MIEALAKNNKGKNQIPSIEGDLYFVPIVDGIEYSHAAETEDMALIIGIGLKYDGVNTKFPQMAARMLKIKTKWAE